MKKIIFLFLILASGLRLEAQDLPRRVFLGIRMQNLTDDMRNIMGIAGTRGVLIDEVLPASTAKTAGFKRGDILVSVNGTVVNATGEVINAIAPYKPGEKFSYELLRNKKKIKGEAVFTAVPEEKYTDLDVIYTDVKSVAGQQRVIITKPKNKTKLPVVVFIGGIGCYSLDNALDTTRSESQLLNMLSRQGYMCVRPEKPGMGDNARYCKACKDVSFTEELDGYIKAIQKIKLRPDVDSSSVFVIGHSMGGVFAPLIAQKTKLKGTISYGTIGSNFIEHLLKTRRTIGEAYGWAPDETDAFIKDFCECVGYYYVSKMTSAEAAAKKADCGQYLSVFDLRSRAYNDELYAFNIPGLWKPFEG
ncbi:MAG TPA: PDZ domain-containing protein, partial [Flavobacteriales bacterium]|nr:PDZ domain-containing protein [Flavobacteriales bacterium]